MKTKVAWRCQEIFFFAEWSLYIKSKWYIFSWGPSWQFLHNTSTADESRHCHDKYRSFLQQSNNKCKKWIFPINFALLLFFSGCIELIEIKGPDHVQRELGWPFKSKCFFTIYFFLHNLGTWSGPLYNPKELQLTLSTTYILKSGSGKTNYKICLGTKPALMDCLLNVLS